MIVTFPHMGNLYVPIKVILDELRIDYVLPPRSSPRNRQRGIRLSPEFICMPFKVMLGDFVDSIEKGADTIFFGGGCGQCRLGHYGMLFHEILESEGFQASIISFELNDMSIGDFYKKLRPLLQHSHPFGIIRALLCSGVVLFEVEALFRLACRIRCRETVPFSTDRLMQHFENAIYQTKGFGAIRKLIAETRRNLHKIATDRSANPLRIAILGEIYTSTDFCANMEIERILGNMGIEVYNYQCIGQWIKDHFFSHILPIRRKNTPRILAQPYINSPDIGGHGLETVGNIAACAGEKFDGIIHLYPLTCMPEIIAETAFPALYKKYGVPVLTLVMDELTGEAGYMTRIEAFSDMLLQKRKRRPSAAAQIVSVRAKAAQIEAL